MMRRCGGPVNVRVPREPLGTMPGEFPSVPQTMNLKVWLSLSGLSHPSPLRMGVDSALQPNRDRAERWLKERTRVDR